MLVLLSCVRTNLKHYLNKLNMDKLGTSLMFPSRPHFEIDIL